MGEYLWYLGTAEQLLSAGRQELDDTLRASDPASRACVVEEGLVEEGDLLSVVHEDVLGGDHLGDARFLIACGEDPALVTVQLGHTDPAFTLRTYAHVMSRAPG